ncbi:MAG: hypothetical protein ACMXX7_02305 [Candidatus Woesearchaeota archaeon]
MKKRILGELSYFITIVALMIFIAFFAYFIGPLLLIGNQVASATITGILGFILGWFVALFMRDLDDATHHHHAALILVVIAGAAINFLSVYGYVMSSVDIITNFNSTVIPVIFSTGFVAPYLIITYLWK